MNPTIKGITEQDYAEADFVYEPQPANQVIIYKNRDSELMGLVDWNEFGKILMARKNKREIIIRYGKIEFSHTRVILNTETLQEKRDRRGSYASQEA